MPPALAYAPAPEVDLLAAFAAHCARLGLASGSTAPGRPSVPAALARSAGLGR